MMSLHLRTQAERPSTPGKSVPFVTRERCRLLIPRPQRYYWPKSCWLTGVSGEALHEALRNLKRGYPFIAMLPVLGAGASREGGGPKMRSESLSWLHRW